MYSCVIAVNGTGEGRAIAESVPMPHGALIMRSEDSRSTSCALFHQPAWYQYFDRPKVDNYITSCYGGISHREPN